MLKTFTKKTIKGQVMLEYTFCLTIIVLMIYGATKVFEWSGKDLAKRQKAHDATFFYQGFDENNPSYSNSFFRQIDPYFYEPIKMNAIYMEGF